MARLSLVAFLLLGTGAPLQARPAEWASEVREASERFGIPQSWIRRVIAAESGGRAVVDGRPVTSRAGAMGLMQLMPATWEQMRQAHGLGPNPYRPRDNILAGTAYLRAMYDRFGYPGLFAAYNAGPARYARHLSSGEALPQETLDYLARTAARRNGDPLRPEPAPAPLLAIRAARPSGGAPGPEDASGLFAIDRRER